MAKPYDIQQIITGCIKKERQFQRVLVDKYSGLLYAICCRYLQGTDEANDGLQEILIRIFQNLDSFDQSKGSFEGWATTIAIRHCLTKLRKKNLKILSTEDKLVNQASYEIETDILSNYDLIHITKFVADLPETYRSVFNLAAIDGYSHKEVSQLLGISEATSRTRLNRAKNILKDRISRLTKTESWVDTI